MIPVVSIVGESNSGKTTLIEKITKKLKKQNYKIGLIKHDTHQFEIDYPGKDTWRMSKAGGDTVIISSREKLAMIKRVAREYKLDEIIQNFMKDVDIVITEGYKNEKKPKILVLKDGRKKSKTNINNRLFAIVSKKNEKIKKIIFFKHDDIKKIVDFIIEKFIKRRVYDR